MRKQISRAMIIVLALVSLSQFVRATPAPAGTVAAKAYGLGVSMGFASFQSVVPSGFFYARDALEQARDFANQLNAYDNISLNIAPLNEMIKAPGNSQGLASRIVATRGEYSGALQKFNKRGGDAYDLGVAISIAEAQATVGDPARGIVGSSLINAKAPAKRLGLPVSDLSNIIRQVNQGAPMDSIYNQITYLRGKFQSLL